jgi:modulator of FtsH protease HflK
MPWSNQSGGGGWKGGGGPWGPRPSGPGQQPDLEDILRRGQDRIRQAMPGGRLGGPFAVLLAVVVIALIGFFGFTVRVNPEELGIVLQFGKYVRQLPPGLNFRWPYPIEEVELPKVTRLNRIEIGMRGTSAADSRDASSAIRDVPEESLMLTGDENIVDVDFVVFWQIKNAPEFLFNIQNPEGTVKDVAESAMREIVGRSDIEPILTEARAKTEFDVQQLMQKILDSYGAGVLVT